VHRRGGENRAGIAGGDECVGLAFADQSDPDHEAGFAFATDGFERPIGHADDFGRFPESEPRAIEPWMPGELLLEGGCRADQLEPESWRQLAEREHGPLDFGARGVIAPHRVERDADHPQLSSTSSRFLPA
jgi:hypothetical protein